MHNEEYPNMMDNQNPYYDLYYRDYVNRLAFARDNGCNTVMLTGTAEPQQNMTFLREFGVMNQNLDNPFRWIEIQTTGILLDKNNLRFLRNHVGVSTISLSMSSFDWEKNMGYNRTPANLAVKLVEFSSLVKEYGFNLRLSLNMTDDYESLGLENVFKNIWRMNADQVTFRKLYSQKGTEQGSWVDVHACRDAFITDLENHIKKNGKLIGVLEYGQEQWALNGVSYVFDNDCMAKGVKGVLKYLVLRPNARLYSSWDNKASLVF